MVSKNMHFALVFPRRGQKSHNEKVKNLTRLKPVSYFSCCIATANISRTLASAVIARFGFLKNLRGVVAAASKCRELHDERFWWDGAA